MKRFMLTALASLMAATPAMAQTSFQSEHFEPLAGQGRTSILSAARSDTLAPGSWSAGLFFHYANSPLKVTAPGDDTQVLARLIENQLTGELLLGLGLVKGLDINVALPVTLWQTGDDLALVGRPGASISGVSLSDIRITPKVTLLESSEGFGVGFALPFYLPVGDTDQFRSDNSIRVEPRLVADWRHTSGVVVAGNLAYQLRTRQEVRNIVFDDALRWNLAATTPLGVDWARGVGSVFGNVATRNDIDPLTGDERDESSAQPLEGLLGLEFDLPADLVASVGGGLGLSGGVGAPAWRAFASLSYAPADRDPDGDGVLLEADSCPDIPEDKDGFQDEDGCPDLDNDGDDIPDAVDTCKNEKEDIDGFKDEDGCPDLDNDGDDIPDGTDACKDQAEDKDGYKDEDGCPDPDNDGDGIKDEEDKCRDEAGIASEQGCPIRDTDGDGIFDDVDKCKTEKEDIDGFKDADGCPDLDNDGDGIPDTVDACPLQSGVAQPDPTKAGCPKDTKVRITRTQVQIDGTIFFGNNAAVIQKKSFKLVDEIAQTLQKFPQITKLRVEGHTDDIGKDENNLKLSKERAKAVRDYLVSKGVKPEVLTSEGYGKSKPRCKDIPEAQIGKKSRKKALKACRASNRRVEFQILELGGKPVGTKKAITIEKKTVEEVP